MLTSIAFISSSCKKNDVKKSRPELLMGSWIQTAETINPPYDLDQDGTNESDIFSLYSQCIKDDYYDFKAQGAGEFNEGATKCDPADDQTGTFSWELRNNDNTLVWYGDSYTLDQLDENTLKFSDTFSENNVTYTYTLTFKRR